MTDLEDQMAGELRDHGEVEIGGVRYARVVASTEWLRPGDDIAAVVRAHLGPQLRAEDVVIVSEKALVIAAGFGVPAEGITVTPLARWLARRVRPTAGSRGLSIPEKMQYVVDEVGVLRVVAATVVSGLTRPFGVRGAFYMVAGRVARATDGMRPPFEHLLLPSLPPRLAAQLAREMAAAVGAHVAVVDVNDRGGSVRSVSGGPLSRRQLLRVLADNPLGQRDARTPIGYVRRLP